MPAVGESLLKPVLTSRLRIVVASSCSVRSWWELIQTLFDYRANALGLGLGEVLPWRAAGRSATNSSDIDPTNRMSSPQPTERHVFRYPSIQFEVDSIEFDIALSSHVPSPSYECLRAWEELAPRLSAYVSNRSHHTLFHLSIRQ